MTNDRKVNRLDKTIPLRSGINDLARIGRARTYTPYCSLIGFFYVHSSGRYVSDFEKFTRRVHFRGIKTQKCYDSIKGEISGLRDITFAIVPSCYL